jgi:hypothetical protein
MDLTPMGKTEAAKLVDRYLARFAYLSLPDPEGYQTALLEVAQRYPKWAGDWAIERANPDNPNLPVSSIVLRKWLEEIVAPHRSANEWDARSARQIDDRKLLEEGPPTPKQSYHEFKMGMAERGLPIDRNDPLIHGETPEQFMQKYGLSREQWNAIPEGPRSDHWEQLMAKHRLG